MATVYRALYIGGLIVVGVAIRASNYSEVFADGKIIFPGFDPYYHMRRIFQTIHDFPFVPYFDSSMNYPHGASVIWPPLFDWSMAFINILAGHGVGATASIETVAAFLIPVLGACIAAPVYLLVREIFEEKTAYLSAGLSVLIPQHIWYSRLGYVDHHVAVTLIQVTMFFIFIRAYKTFAHTGAPADLPGLTINHFWLITFATLSIVIGFITWNGYIYYVALLDLFLLIVLIIDGNKRGSKIPALCWMTHIPAGLLMLPFIYTIVSYTHKPFTTITFSYFHACSVLAFGTLGLLFHLYQLPLSGAGRRLRNGAVIVVSAGFLVLAGMQSDSFIEGFEWLFTSEPFMATVNESKPILMDSQGKLDFLFARFWLTYFFFLTPVILALLLYKGAKTRFADRKIIFLIVWAGAMFLTTLKQRRFGETFAPAEAILIAWFLIEVHRWIVHFLTARNADGYKAAIASGSLLAMLTFFAFTPGFNVIYESPKSLIKSWTNQRDDYVPQIYRQLSLFKEKLKPGEAGSFGVLSPWPLGHHILYVTGAPVVSNNFGAHIGYESYRDWALFFLSDDEEKALDILRERNIRYVIASYNLDDIGAAIIYRGERMEDYVSKRYLPDGSISTVLKPNLLKTIFVRMTRFIGSESQLPNAKGYVLKITALNHFRLVQDSIEDDKREYLKIYEFVPGAILSISGPPLAKLTIEYKYRSMAGRDRVYKKTVVTG
ncbi:hypothetical protein MNBD_NITROSPINAE03-1891, partial [hydrothermal vent metagenome]